MEYKIEIWQFHHIIETYENDDIEEIIKWYREHWKFTHENGNCAIYIYKNDVRFSINEEFETGIYEDYDKEVEDE